MSVKVERAVLWRTETDNSPGALSNTLSPLAELHEDLQIVIGYSYPDRRSAAIEVYPVRSRTAQVAAKKVGLSASNFPCLVVTGENRAGLSHDISTSLADAGINLNFFIGQVIGTRYTALFGFEAESEAALAAQLIRKATNRGTGGAVKPSKKKAAVRAGARRRK